MAIEIKALHSGIGRRRHRCHLHKQPGDAVKRDELIVDIETDKVVMEVLAEADGVLTEIVKNEGDTVLSGELLGKLEAALLPPLHPLKLPPRPRPLLLRQPLPARVAKSRSWPRRPASWPKRTVLIEQHPRYRQGRSRDQEDVVAAVEAKKSAPAAAAKPAAPAAAAPIFAEGDRVEARADDPPACQGRRASGRSPVLHGYADYVQRSQHEADHGTARQVQGPLREDP